MEIKTQLSKTTLSKTEQDALKAFISASAQERNARANQQKQVDDFMIARQRAAKEFKQKMFDQALRAAGIEAQDLLNRQTRDSEAVTAFISKQKSTLLNRAASINKTNAAIHAERLSRSNHVATLDSMMSQQSIVLTLDTAAEILLSGTGTSSIASNNNLAFTKASVASSGYLGGPLQGNLVDIDWLFVWTPPRDGLLDVVSFLSMNGSSTVLTNSTCDGGSSSSNISAAITLSQGNMKDTSATDIFDSSVSSSWGDSLGAVNFIALDETDTVGYRPTQFPVIADIPIIITVSASLYALVQNGQAELDFMSGDFRLNVPYVFLQLI